MDIKAIRVKLGMTQTEFADALDVTQQVVSSWESGQTKPRLARVKEIDALVQGGGASRVPKKQGTIILYSPPKRPKIQIDVWPYRRT